MIGPQRRVISAAFSVESSAKVISLGQAASWAAGAAASVSTTSSVAAIVLSTRMRDSFPDRKSAVRSPPGGSGTTPRPRTSPWPR